MSEFDVLSKQKIRIRGTWGKFKEAITLNPGTTDFGRNFESLIFHLEIAARSMRADS